MGKYKRLDCIELLQKKQIELNNHGLSRYPQRSDFLPEEVTAIKAFLGPWPRALEAAELKPVNYERLRQKQQKRILHKKAKTQNKLSGNATKHEPGNG